MRFKFLISVTAFTLIAFLANASAETAPASRHDTAPYPDSVYRIKTLEEIERMPPEQAQEYLKDLQDLIVDLELIYQDDFTRTKQAPSFSQFKLLLESMIAPADAAYSAAQYSNVQVGVINSAQGPRRFCGLDMIPVHVNKRSWACQLRSRPRKTPCPSGTIAVNQQFDGSFRCVSNASFNRMDPKDKWGMRAWNVRASNNPKLAEANKNFRALKTKFDNGLRPLSSLNPTSNRKPASRTRNKVSLASKAKDNKTTDQEESEQQPDEAKVGETSESKQSSRRYSRFAGVSDADIAAYSQTTTGQADQDPTLTEGGDQEDADREEIVNRCVPPEKFIPDQCPQEKIEAGRRALYGSKENVCMYGGNFSSYRGKQVAPGQCQRVYEFCFGKLSCRDENYNQTAKPDAYCKADEVICNPYVFSLQKDTGMPFCVKSTVSATRACVEATSKAKRDGNYKPIIDRLWKHAFFKQAVDQDKGDMDKWFAGFNEYTQQLNRMCDKSNENLSAAFCIECNFIRRRLIWMHAKPFANGKCDAFLKLGRTDNRTGDATKTASPPAAAPNPPAAR